MISVPAASPPRLSSGCSRRSARGCWQSSIRQTDAIADVCRWRTEGWFLDAGKPPQKAFSTFGFGRDRRDRLAWILWANAALLAVAYAAYALIVHARRTMAGGSSWTTLLALPLVAFVVGRTLPCAISPLLGSIRPPAGNAGAGLLLDCVSGGTRFSRRAAGGLLAGFALVRRVVAEFEPRESRRRPVRGDGSGHRRLPCRPHAALRRKNIPQSTSSLMSASVIVLAYLLGRTLDYSDPLPLSLAFVPLILTMPAGAALLHADTMWLGLATASIVADGDGGRRRQCDLQEAPLQRPSNGTPVPLSPTRRRLAAAFRPTSKS